MVDASVGRASPGDPILPRLRSTKRAAAKRARSSWRHIPVLTMSLTAAIVVALLAAPARDVATTGSVRPLARPTLSLAAPQTSPTSVAREEPERPPAWAPVEKPFAMFNLEAPEIDRLPAYHVAARHSVGGGRDDVFTFGAFEAQALHLRLSVYQPGGEAAAPSSFFVDLVRRAGEAGLAVRKSVVAGPLPTKFGTFEVADAILAEPGAERPCLAFRFLSQGPALRLSGWACGTAERPADRAMLACLIDRLALVAAREERALAAYFAKAELSRSPICAAPHLLAAGSKSPWFAGRAVMPPLKDGKAR